MKKQRTIWLTDEDFKKLKQKASEFFQGKGMLEKYLELIAHEQIIIIKGSGKLKIEVIK